MQGVLLLLGICKRALRFGGFKIFDIGLSSFDIIISPNLILLFHTNNMSELSQGVDHERLAVINFIHCTSHAVLHKLVLSEGYAL